MQITYTAQLLKEDGTYVAYAPELDVSSCGDSPDAARHALQEAVTLFLEEMQRAGTLHTILGEAGYREHGGQWEPPEFIGFERTALAFS
ncbi:type II toxin-antitoxin system HicB family antitoxin [Candidatus Uhrbacteria bacterium]|nr:type II toxin-antitoxin system HicB family antitoxin [Candidatus Uhrbacteria bacterium]